MPGTLRLVVLGLEVASAVVRPALSVFDPDRLGIAGVRVIAVGQQDRVRGEVSAQDLEDLLFLARLGIGEADLLALPVHRPEPGGAHLALDCPPGFYRRLIHCDDAALLDRDQLGLVNRLQQRDRLLAQLGEPGAGEIKTSTL